MILRLSVRDAQTGGGHDIEVAAEPDSRVATLLESLPIRVGQRTCYVGAAPLDPDRTLGVSPVVPGVTISVGAPDPQPRVPPAGAVGALRVVAGPDAGAAVWLPPGRYLLGRDPAAAMRLSDPDVSRRQALVDVTERGDVTITDLESTNGTTVDGQQATQPLPLPPGSRLEVGDNQLAWARRPTQPARSTRSPDGRLDFDRAFARAPKLDRVEVVLPVAETSTRNTTTVLVSALAPVAMGGVMAVVLSQPAMLLFALLGPVMALVSQLVERRQRKARSRVYAAKKDDVQRTLSEHVAGEERLRRAAAPDVWDLTLAATGAARGLWPRNADSPDGLVLRVGTADQPASVDLRGEPWPDFQAPTLRDVPVTVDLRATGVLGVVGPAEPVRALVRWLLVQLGTLRSPDDLRLVVVTSDTGDQLAWARWLPHLDDGEGSEVPCRIGNTAGTRAARIAELRELVKTRMAATGHATDARFSEEVVAVLDGALALRHLPGMQEVLRDGPAVDVYSICIDRHDMNECRGLCEVEHAELRLTRNRDDHQPTAARPEHIDRANAERIARAVAPMRDRLTLSGADAAMPYPVRYLDLLDVDTPTAERVLSLWGNHPGPTTMVALGADGSGTVTIDLVDQGPHSMIGGATGTGKSILLQTLVTALLLTNRPDELNLVLVDFKGGPTFLPFELCPHVVTLIRSTGDTPADVLDAAASRRVLASVRAEVRRRESLLARHGGEIDQYWRATRDTPSAQALPRLVLIIDEWARALEEFPDFLKELVNVAAKGRSLGMHLVLSTQSLQGKLTAEMKNNIELRISLRQNETGDSTEVLDVPDATGIPGRLRGRGMIVCTKEVPRRARLFQCGYLGNPPPAGGAAPARVRIVEWPALGDPRPEDHVEQKNVATDLTLTVSAIEKAATILGLPAPFRPVLPPLPADLALEDLAPHATGVAPQTAAPFGLADDPAAQAQPAICLDLAGTDRLLVAGGPQSGRTTFARALITSLATRFSPRRVHLYVIEHQPSGLAAYADLPHCGGVFSPAEPDRIRRLISWLDGEVQRRTLERFAVDGQEDPWIVVVIDGWEHFEDRGDPNFIETSLLATLRRIITAGPPLGVHIVPIGGRDMMTGKLPEHYSRRLLLRFPKEDTRRQHLAAGVVSPPVLQGRGVDAASGIHVQVCRPAISPAALIASATTTWPDDDGVGVAHAAGPRWFPSFPVHRTIDELPMRDPPPTPTWIPVGIGGPDLTTIGVDLFDAGPHLVLISGPAESGRTTAAATLAHGLRRIEVGVLAVAPPRSPLRHMLPNDSGVRLITGTTIKDTDLRDAAAAFSPGPYAVIVDDCDEVTLIPSQEGYADAPTLLQDIAGPSALGNQALILAGDARPILTGQRRSLMRVATEILTTGTRILLTPTNGPTAREHGFTLEPDQYFTRPPGRAYLTDGRVTDLIHIATPLTPR